jgi:hypothetical protein
MTDWTQPRVTNGCRLCLAVRVALTPDRLCSACKAMDERSRPFGSLAALVKAPGFQWPAQHDPTPAVSYNDFDALANRIKGIEPATPADEAMPDSPTPGRHHATFQSTWKDHPAMSQRERFSAALDSACYYLEFASIETNAREMVLIRLRAAHARFIEACEALPMA